MLSQNGIEVTIFVPDDSLSEGYVLTEENALLSIVRFAPDAGNMQRSLGYTARLSYAFAVTVREYIAKNGKPDIIEAQDYLGIAYYLTQYRHLNYDFMAGVPILLTLHSPAFVYLEYNRVPTYRFPDFWTCEMEKQSIKAADLLISPSAFLVDEIGKFMDLKDKDTRVIANPYSINEEPKSFSFRPGKIVYYGKLSPQKGSFQMLEYFRELWDEGFQYDLQVVGGTDILYHPEMQTMGQIVEKKYKTYIDRGLLNFCGKISPSDIGDYLSDAHVVIVPSIVDNMPYVVMEAMQLGRVVLASVQGGQKEMIRDGIDGFLFDHSITGSFASQLRKILALPAERIEETGKNAFDAIGSSYSFENIFSLKFDWLREVMGRPRPSEFPFLYQQKWDGLAPVTNDKALLSVVIPYYNLGAYIGECVASLLASSYKKMEIIIVNDGSTDPESISALERLSARDSIMIVHCKNKGLAATRNEGAALANGDYLAFLDADDKVAPDYYEKAIDALKANTNVFFAGSWVQYFENSDQVWPTFTPQPPYALVHNPVNSSGFVYKKEAFLKGGLNDKAVDYGMEDYESVIHMLACGYNGVIVPEVLFYYRVRTGSMFRNISEKKLLYSNKYIAEKHAAYYSNFAVPVVNLINANGPGYFFDNPTFEVSISVTVRKESGLSAKLKILVKKSPALKRLALIALKKLGR